MDADIEALIIDELTKFLNREPSEDEVINGRTDSLIMGRVRYQQIAASQAVLQSNIDSLQTTVNEVSVNKMV